MQTAPPAPIDVVIDKVIRRLVPFLLLMYVLAFLDRANVGFAKKAFMADTGISDAMFAFGAGVFFLGYALFEVPSNLIMHKVGARAWMCRIMVTWGLVSAGLMFATTETSFYVLRFLLGVAEAGFFPGVIYYLTYWVPASARTRVMGMFYFGAPLAFIFGSPLSGLLLDLDGLAGFKGWEWLFMVEGLLASAVGVWAWWYLDNRPQDAQWLTAQERTLLTREIDNERLQKTEAGPHSVWQTLLHRKVLYFAFIYALIQLSVYGVVFSLPAQVSQLLGVKVGLQVGLVTAIPWLCALCTTYVVSRRAQQQGRYARFAFGCMVVSAVGMALSVHAGSPLVGLLGLSFAASGFIAVQPLFWTFPTRFLDGVAAAGGIALINSLGAAGGFLAPNLKTWVEQSVGLPSAGLDVLAVTTLVGAVLLLSLQRDEKALATAAR
jgi:MFS family permease